MTDLADGWQEIENGYAKGDSGPRITIDPSHVEAGEHGEHVQAPVESPDAYTVSLWRQGGHDHLVHFKNMLDAITFAKLVTKYDEAHGNPMALRNLAKGMAGQPATDRRPSGIVSDREPRAVLEAMVGTETYVLDRALDGK